MDLSQARTHYVDEIRLDGGAKNADVHRVFATVPREHFYGPGPWRFAMRELITNTGNSYLTTDDADPAIAQVTEVRRDAHAPTSNFLFHRDGACLRRPVAKLQPSSQLPLAQMSSLMKF